MNCCGARNKALVVKNIVTYSGLIDYLKVNLECSKFF